MRIPSNWTDWFLKKGWKIHSYQKKMFTHFNQKQSVLLVAPTGGGKTLASFLPVLNDIHFTNPKGLHTLYISPLVALVKDIQRNLKTLLDETGLDISIDMRTGDTSSYRRNLQKKKPPSILLTTPESLMLLLSYKNSAQYFATLQAVIIDEVHTLASSKRGDLLALGLSQLNIYAPKAMRMGLSATVEKPLDLAQWLKATEVLIAKPRKKPDIALLQTRTAIPYNGYLARYAIKNIYQTLQSNKLTIVFVNTRSQAEFIFQQLWQMNVDNLPIAIYHGSLSKEQRTKTETLTVKHQLRAIVATSALELGIDWGDIDCVLQVGAPLGISRLLQRIGRSNHQFNQSSLAKLVPANCFDALECQAAIDAIDQGKIDGDVLQAGALDVLVQFIVNCACSSEITPGELYKIITNSYPYRDLSEALFLKLFEYATNGGYVLKHYEQYHRLIENNNHYSIASEKTARRHRQNIGTIIEPAQLLVKVLNKRKDKILGNIEEKFIQHLSLGDTFMFSGLVVQFIRVRDMFVEVRKFKSKKVLAKLPAYAGGTLPLSPHLADEVSALINTPSRWKILPEKIRNWLDLQNQFSKLPSTDSLLIEQYRYKKNFYLTIYCFEGRRANYTLGMLLTKRMEILKLMPLSFNVTNYGLAIKSLKQVTFKQLDALFSKRVIEEELEKWLGESSLLKRSFREVAVISGLIERKQAGNHKSMKQVTFSTDLIYEVLQKYEPNHVLLKMARLDAGRILLDVERLQNLLKRFENKLSFIELSKPSPMSILFLTTFNSEKVHGDALEELLIQNENELLATKLMKEVSLSVKR